MRSFCILVMTEWEALGALKHPIILFFSDLPASSPWPHHLSHPKNLAKPGLVLDDEILYFELML